MTIFYFKKEVIMMSNDSENVKHQHEVIGVQENANSHSHTRHPDAQWFPAAGLGIFLHWGISSLNGDIDLSWGMIRDTPNNWHYLNTNKVVPSEYFAYADRFDPEAYDPDLWMAAASNAGVRYAVLTTRHHDGYALWPSEYGNYSTRTHMHGRDLLRPYVEACRKYNIKVGFYYSPPDWNFFKDFMSFGYPVWDWDDVPDVELCEQLGLFLDRLPLLDENWQEVEALPIADDTLKTQYSRYLRGQIEELLTRYGPIDIIWFDGTPSHDVAVPITQEEIRQLQPGILINPRMHGFGDFETPECALPDAPIEGFWEACFIWNEGSWGYTKNETYKPLTWMLDKLVKARAWGGNLLINVAPSPDGRLPEACYRRFEELARWQKENSESICGVSRGKWPDDCSVPYTVRNDNWFLFMTDEASIAVIDHESPPKSVTVLATGEPVPFVSKNAKTLVTLYARQRADTLSVIKIEW